MSVPLYERVCISRVDLIDLEARTSLRADALPAQSPQLLLDASAEGEMEGERAIVQVAFTMTGVDAITGAEALRIVARYRLVYAVTTPGEPEPRPEDIHQLAHVSGIYNAWGFFREVVASTSWRMNLPLPLIPSLPPHIAAVMPWQGER